MNSEESFARIDREARTITRNSDGTYRLEIQVNNGEGQWHLIVPKAVLKNDDTLVAISSLREDAPATIKRRAE